MTEKQDSEKHVTTNDLMHEMQGQGARITEIERRLEMMQSAPQADVNNAVIDSLARFTSELTRLGARVTTLEGDQRELRIIAVSVQGSLDIIRGLAQSRDAQVSEHGRDIDKLQEAVDALHIVSNSTRAELVDLGNRMGRSMIPLIGVDPTSSDTRPIPSLIDRVGTIERGLTGLQAQMQANADALQAIQRQLAAIGEFAQRVVPPRVRKLIFNVTFLRLILIIGGALLGVNLLELLPVTP